MQGTEIGVRAEADRLAISGMILINLLLAFASSKFGGHVDYTINQDIELVKELLGISFKDLARAAGVDEATLHRWRSGASKPSATSQNSLYDYVYRQGIRLNEIKSQLHQEQAEASGRVLIFHGAKNDIDGLASLGKSKPSNDLGMGFYCGETYAQSVMFVAGYPSSSVYLFGFDSQGLACVDYAVGRDWMLTVAWYRGKLSRYADHQRIRSLRERLEGADYAVAPIADNRMFALIDSFGDGEITDVQCQHCLAATNLGRQYVLRSGKALSQLEGLERCYLAPAEKELLLRTRAEESALGSDKVKVARRQFRGQGLYVDELFS